MCEKCDELKEKIERFKRLRARTLDEQVLAGIANVVSEFEAQIAAMHDKQQKNLEQILDELRRKETAERAQPACDAKQPAKK